MTTDLGIVDLLKVYGFDDQLPTKLVRHKDARYDIPTLRRTGWFELYQATQSKPVFKHCRQVVSCGGDGPGRARLIGVYRVNGEREPDAWSLPADCPYPEWATKPNYWYDLQRLPQFDPLGDRVVIEWVSELAWHQHLKNYPVVELHPPGRKLPPFTDYLGFTLTHHELVDLVANPTAHRDWVSSLSAVAGVYLILAQASGQQYVGSAYGTGGIWGRWTQYASSGHGGNVKLVDLLATNPAAYPSGFRYSLLQVLPKSTTSTEVIRWESLYKAKLGSRATGLNPN